jgi:hypothetical protein
MVKLQSNLGEIDAWMKQLVDSFNFQRPGKDQSLGRDIAGAIANGIRDRSVPDAMGPDGDKWDDNEESYAAEKRQKYDADQPNVRTGQMLSLQSLMGRTTVEPELVEMRYGVDEPPSSAFNGTELTEGDKAVTDIQKAEWCSVTRPFYALDEEIKAAARAEAGEALNDHLK